MRGHKVALAAVVATIAFGLYSVTLLPGVDLGDTAAFQASLTWPERSARQAYPLYYALGGSFVHLVSPGNPARGANLFSALMGAIAAGLLTWIVGTVTRSIAGGVVAGLLLAFSYTYWTQAVIAEVYTLHLALVGVTLVALAAWQRRPTDRRLALCGAAYALSFGNHLSTILLFLPCAAFLVLAAERPRALFRLRVILGGLAIAALGSLQYLPNFLALWFDISAPAPWSERLASFWFDVTKADWRASMVLGVSAGGSMDRLAMLLWDARQQFGLAGLSLALIGIVSLLWRARPWGVLVLLAYVVNTLFALTYNVGDTHVFLLPGHYFTAFAAGAGAAAIIAGAAGEAVRAHWPRRALAAAAAGVLVALALWRGWETWPATDRHRDRRGEELATRVLTGVASREGVLVSRMNWDQENALLYAGRHTQRDVTWTRLYDVFPHFPFFVRDNHAIGRDVVLTAQAAARVVGAYGAHFPLVEDEVVGNGPLSEVLAGIPRGSPYVVTVLSPSREFGFDAEDLAAGLEALIGRPARVKSGVPYTLIAGVAGEPPEVRVEAALPFVRRFALAGDRYTARMDAWLPIDTFRRGGFGHVILDRRPLLFVERGVSIVWLNRQREPVIRYAGSPYAPERRFRIPVTVTGFASR